MVFSNFPYQKNFISIDTTADLATLVGLLKNESVVTVIKKQNSSQTNSRKCASYQTHDDAKVLENKDNPILFCLSGKSQPLKYCTPQLIRKKMTNPCSVIYTESGKQTRTRLHTFDKIVQLLQLYSLLSKAPYITS